MRPFTLQALTWTTVTAAVGSALWLAAAESGQQSAAWQPGKTPPPSLAADGRVITVSLESLPAHGKHAVARPSQSERR